LVEIACFSNKGILAPAGIVTTFGSAADGKELAATAFADAGFVASVWLAEFAAAGAAFCPNAIPEIRTTVKKTRIVYLPTLARARLAREYHAASA
jgi:hypothetical protein